MTPKKGLKAKTSDLSRVGVGVWEISKLVPLGTYIEKCSSSGGGSNSSCG
jgi:hypothetical protein